MSEIQPVQTEQTKQAEQIQAQEGVNASPSGEIDGNASFSTYSDFAHQYPALHKVTMQSLANSMIEDLKRHAENMKRIQRESQNN